MSAIHPFHRVVAATARQPRPAPLPLRAPARMPAYARALSGEELHALADWLESLR